MRKRSKAFSAMASEWLTGKLKGIRIYDRDFNFIDQF